VWTPVNDELQDVLLLYQVPEQRGIRNGHYGLDERGRSESSQHWLQYLIDLHSKAFYELLLTMKGCYKIYTTM
jgi:hypothetical protein